MHVEPTLSARHGRHRAVGRDAPQRLHRREAGGVDGRAPGGNPERAARRDDVDPARADVHLLPDRSALGIDLEQVGAAAGDPERPGEQRHPLGGVTGERRDAGRPIRTRVEPDEPAIAVVHDPRRRALEDEIGRPVADLDAGRDAALRRCDPEHGSGGVVHDPHRPRADPDVVRRLGLERDPLDHPTRARSDAGERAEAVERPDGAEAGRHRDHRRVEADGAHDLPRPRGDLEYLGALLACDPGGRAVDRERHRRPVRAGRRAGPERRRARQAPRCSAGGRARHGRDEREKGDRGDGSATDGRHAVMLTARSASDPGPNAARSSCARRVPTARARAHRRRRVPCGTRAARARSRGATQRPGSRAGRRGCPRAGRR